MKKNLMILVGILITLGWNSQAHSWSGETHKALTEKAVSNNNQSILDSYLKDELGMGQGLTSILLLDESITPDSQRVLPKIPQNPTVLDLLQAGAALEDIPLPRARHHFHDPYHNTGLENKSEHPARAPVINWFSQRIWGLSFDLTGASTLKRALGTENPNWEQEYENYFAWPDTRYYFYKALTEESQTTREHYLALTFLALGHVSHLLEDMGVPPHARNDFVEAHFRAPKGLWKNPLEEYVEKEIASIEAIPSRWLSGWTPQAKVFSKLAYYWDIENYTGQYVGTSPLSNWGLSEQTNYQFLSKSTIFRANDGTKYYFPHPNVNNVTGYVESGVYFWNSAPVNYRYISGYGITHLARNKFIDLYSDPIIPYPIATVAYHTTFDDRVYEDYAEATLPRTINYTTGLINYFFRGRLSVEPNCLDGSNVQLIITNDSNNSGIPQTLKGGIFELYWDNVYGERTEVTSFSVDGWNSSSTLGYGQSVTGQFTCPEQGARNYIIVYKGNICENPADPDADDSNAIAAVNFQVPVCSSPFPETSINVIISGVEECSGIPEDPLTGEPPEGCYDGYHGWFYNINGTHVLDYMKSYVGGQIVDYLKVISVEDQPCIYLWLTLQRFGQCKATLTIAQKDRCVWCQGDGTCEILFDGYVNFNDDSSLPLTINNKPATCFEGRDRGDVEEHDYTDFDGEEWEFLCLGYPDLCDYGPLVGRNGTAQIWW